MIVLEKNVEFPAIYIQINYEILKISFKNPGLSLPEFYIFSKKIDFLYVNNNDNLDRLRYDGEYLDGKRQGKGKSYNYNKKTVFEGEYLNGKKNGKGKKYYFNDNIIFEGEYLNGQKEGKGKEYYNKILIFEGEFKAGEKNGKGKEYDSSDGKLYFEGEYKNGKKVKGRFYDNNGKLLREINN